MCLLLTRCSHYITTYRYLQQNVQRRIYFTSLYSCTTSYIVLLHVTLLIRCADWISIKEVKPLYIGAFYRPPTTDEVYIGKLGQAVEMIPANANLLLGDFNIPDVDWNSFTFPPGGCHTAVSKTMIDIAISRHLTQVVKEPKRGKNNLDLCFTNCEQLVEKTSISPGISDHDIVTVIMSLKPPRLRKPARRVFI